MKSKKSNLIIISITVLAVIVLCIVFGYLLNENDSELAAKRNAITKLEEESLKLEEETKALEEEYKKLEEKAAAQDAEIATLEEEINAFLEGISVESFEDALFIGDSRTNGIDIYGNIDDTTYFANTGMSIYGVHKEKIEVRGVGTVTLEELLTQKEFRKIFVMLGCNEIRSDIDKTVQKNEEFLAYLQEKQPTAIVIYQANLHFADKRNGYVEDNVRFEELHTKLKAFADNKKVFFIDANPLFDDENGNMKSEVTWDGAHLYGEYYEPWCDWIREETKEILKVAKSQ